MTPKTLRVRASGTALVQDHAALERGTNRFIGRKYQELEGKPGEYGFVPTEDEEVEYRPEYIHALKEGDLEAVDEPTRAAAGLKKPEQPKVEEKKADVTSGFFQEVPGTAKEHAKGGK